MIYIVRKGTKLTPPLNLILTVATFYINRIMSILDDKYIMFEFESITEFVWTLLSYSHQYVSFAPALNLIFATIATK